MWWRWADPLDNSGIPYLSIEAWHGMGRMSIDLHAAKIEDGDGDSLAMTDEYGDEVAAAR
jgi:hypothetical protein